MPVFVTATLLIYAWAGQTESQRHGEPKNHGLSARHGGSLQHTQRRSVKCELWGLSSMRLYLASVSAGAAEVTKALAGCCCSVSGGVCQPAVNWGGGSTLCPSCDHLIDRMCGNLPDSPNSPL